MRNEKAVLLARRTYRRKLTVICDTCGALLAVIATYRSRPGESDRVAALLARHTAPTQTEPGCLCFIVNRCTADSDQFVLYEQYVDEAAFQAHRETEHFRRFIEGGVALLLMERSWQRYTVIEPDL